MRGAAAAPRGERGGAGPGPGRAGEAAGPETPRAHRARSERPESSAEPCLHPPSETPYGVLALRARSDGAAARHLLPAVLGTEGPLFLPAEGPPPGSL